MPGNVTDKKGNFFEMIEYLPYGETLYDEAATADKTEFRFTSQEQDTETGLYYYGARYRDAKTGVWLSCDPIFEKYLEGEPNGGIYNFINLNLYAYAADNPIRFSDPDGNKFKDKVETAGVFLKRFALTSFLLLQRNTWGNPGHVSAEKLNEMEPIPPSKSKVEDNADVAAWLAEPLVAYGMLKIPTMRSGKVAGPKTEKAVAAERATTDSVLAKLNDAQKSNLKRFNKKVPQNSTETKIDFLGEDINSILLTAESPGKVPGSKAVYQKMIGPLGETESFIKNTFDQIGNVIHIKDKINGTKIPEK